MVVYLDMDGVIADFVGAALRLHEYPNLFSEPRCKGKFDLEKLLDISVSKFWKPINECDNFWRERIYKTEDANEIVAFAEGIGETAILTAPSLGNNCIPGKIAWVQREYPQFSRRIAFSGEKGLFASPRHILIDDKDSNILEFNRMGGKGLLVPRPWNSLHSRSGEVMGVLREQMDLLRLNL